MEEVQNELRGSETMTEDRDISGAGAAEAKKGPRSAHGSTAGGQLDNFGGLALGEMKR